MAGLTNRITDFLMEMMEENAEGMIEIGRNELAQRFSCAPSQINYVLTTRFTPYNGYYTESRRGGSGYIRIIRLERSPEEAVGDLIQSAVDTEITSDKAKSLLHSLFQQGILEKREYHIMSHAVDDRSFRAIPQETRNSVRADVLKNMLIVLLR